MSISTRLRNLEAEIDAASSELRVLAILPERTTEDLRRAAQLLSGVEDAMRSALVAIECERRRLAASADR